MPATQDQLNQSIEPGSIPHGDRQGLEQGLADIGGAPPSGGPPGAGGPLPSPSNPLQSLLSGEVTPGGDVPLTDGLSVGPGSGGAQGVPDARKERLKILAQHAQSPTLRSGAMAALRKYDQEGL